MTSRVKLTARIDGAKGNFQWTGKDTFAGANIFCVALEVPNGMLGRGPIGTWITVSLRRDGTLVQMDREGNPSFNPILNPNGVKDEFNATDPIDDVKKHLQPLSDTLQQHGYPPGEAKEAAAPQVWGAASRRGPGGGIRHKSPISDWKGGWQPVPTQTTAATPASR